MKPPGSDGIVDKTHPPEVTIRFTTRDLGDTSTFPTTATPVQGNFPGQAVVFYRTVQRPNQKLKLDIFCFVPPGGV